MRIISNFLFLFLSKSSGLVLFLIITPLLISRIGLEKLGLISVALGIVYIFDSFVEYSFNITVVQDIAINREDKNKISRIFVDTFFAKIILLLIAIIAYLLLMVLVNKFRQEFVLYLLAFSFIIGRSINPLWYFMGIEKMHFITITSLISKAFYLFSVYFFITTESDYVFVNLFFGLSEILSSIVILIYVYVFEKLNFPSFSFVNSRLLIFRDFKFSTALFLNKVYTNIPIIFLGIFATPLSAGIYSVADKIIANVKDLIGLFYNSIMPYFASIFFKEKEKTIRKLWQLIFIIVGVYLISIFPIFYFSKLIISFFTNEHTEQIQDVFLILYVSVLFSLLKLPHSVFITLKRLDNYFLLSCAISALLILFYCYFSISYAGEVGAAVSVFFGEITIVLILTYFLYRNEKAFFKIK